VWFSCNGFRGRRTVADANSLLDVDLISLVSTLDNTASEIVAYQRDSTVQRKDLAQKTKDFRKLDDAAKLVEFKGLLKGKETLMI
jgi:homeobox protein cut-like